MSRAVWIVLGLALGSVVSAGPFDGDYRTGPDADCSRIGEDGGALRIRDGIFEGVESSCRMTNPVQVVDMDAKLYTFECSGEGEVWKERTLLMNAADGQGIIMLWNGYAFTYERCPAPKAD